MCRRRSIGAVRAALAAASAGVCVAWRSKYLEESPIPQDDWSQARCGEALIGQRARTALLLGWDGLDGGGGGPLQEQSLRLHGASKFGGARSRSLIRQATFKDRAQIQCRDKGNGEASLDFWQPSMNAYCVGMSMVKEDEHDSALEGEGPRILSMRPRCRVTLAGDDHFMTLTLESLPQWLRPPIFHARLVGTWTSRDLAPPLLPAKPTADHFHAAKAAKKAAVKAPHPTHAGSLLPAPVDVDDWQSEAAREEASLRPQRILRSPEFPGSFSLQYRGTAAGGPLIALGYQADIWQVWLCPELRRGSGAFIGPLDIHALRLLLASREGSDHDGDMEPEVDALARGRLRPFCTVLPWRSKEAGSQVAGVEWKVSPGDSSIPVISHVLTPSIGQPGHPQQPASGCRQRVGRFHVLEGQQRWRVDDGSSESAMVFKRGIEQRTWGLYFRCRQSSSRLLRSRMRFFEFGYTHPAGTSGSHWLCLDLVQADDMLVGRFDHEAFDNLTSPEMLAQAANPEAFSFMTEALRRHVAPKASGLLCRFKFLSPSVPWQISWELVGGYRRKAVSEMRLIADVDQDLVVNTAPAAVLAARSMTMWAA